jgi:aminocarboxymuconate-semialdehyde decarboxylase
MDSIDIHFHVVPPQFVDAVRREQFAEAARIERTGARDHLIYAAPPDVVVEPDTTLHPAEYDERLMLDGLDRRKLDAAVIGPSPGLFFYWAEPALGARIAGALNDGIAAMVRAHPGRFVGMGTVPMQDGTLAARELERAVTTLGLRAIEICTHINGVDLDDPRFDPVFAAAERLNVPFFIHPQNWGDMRRLKNYHLWNLVGFPTETALAAAHLITGGVFERHPGLKVVLAHGGGYFPYQIGRLDHGFDVRREVNQHLPRRPSEYLGGIYCDTITHNSLALRFLLDRVGDDHVVIGTDYPFDMGYDAPVDVVRDLDLGAEREAKVLGRNLARLLDLA